MKTTPTLQSTLLGIFIVLLGIFTQAQPILGAYDTTFVKSGQSILVNPDSAPSSLAYTAAFTDGHFTGIFSTNPISGAVRITNANPAGIYKVTVQASDSAGTITDTTFTLIVTDPLCSHGTFTDTTTISVPNDPGSIAMGDFNNDGILDFATTHSNANNVSIKFGDGLGGFSGSTIVIVGKWPNEIAIGDFNGDGKQDFASANVFFGNVSIRLGNGAGGFAVAPDVEVGTSPNYIATADFNGDGMQDLATANTQSNDVSILIGDGRGGFSNIDTIVVGPSPSQLAIGDFNSDGNQDFASSGSWSGGISIRLGDGLGGFSHDSTLEAGAALGSVAIGDFNSDGHYDLASTRYSRDQVYIWLGDGFGKFDTLSIIKVGDGPGNVTIGDFNGDGNHDIATTNGISQDVSIALGDGLGAFSGIKTVSIGQWPGSLAFGDFNLDGRLDLALANSFDDEVVIRLGENFPVSKAFLEACEDSAGSRMGIFDLRQADTVVDVAGGNMASYYLNQFEAENDTNPIVNPDAYITHDSTLVWARIEDIWGCFAVEQVMLTTKSTPGNPSLLMGYEIFRRDTVPVGEGLLANCASQAYWYSNPTGGTPIDSGAVFDPTAIGVSKGGVDVNAVGLYHYYVSCESEGCASFRSQVDFEVLNSNAIQNPLLSSSFIFHRIFPNPTNDQITMEFTLQFPDQVHIRLYNGLGQVVAEKTDLGKNGFNQITWIMPPLSSGLYQVEITCQNFSLNKKLVVIN